MDDTVNVRGAARSIDIAEEAEDEAESDVSGAVKVEEDSGGVMRLMVKEGGDCGRGDEAEDDGVELTCARDGGVMLC